MTESDSRPGSGPIHLVPAATVFASVQAFHWTIWVALLLGVAVACAQPAPDTPTGLTDQQTAKLNRNRAIIENTADSTQTRQAQAEELLLTGWPAATDLLIELLAPDRDASTRVVVCRAVERIQRSSPALVDHRVVEPLVAALADNDASVASSASAALSSFRDEGVVRRLGALAAESDRPRGQRLALVAALAPNIDHYPVVEQLVALLGVEDDEVRARVIQAMGPASRVDYGANVAAWTDWWAKKSKLRDEQEDSWLLDRVGLFVERCRTLTEQVAQSRRECDERCGMLAARLKDALRQNYRLTAQQAQRDELLIAWLGDPLLDLRRTAVELVRERIYDQERPSDAVRAALRGCYSDPSPELRLEVLELVGALNDPADLDPMLARLAAGSGLGPRERETILGVVGKLRNPAAIGLLIDEIANQESPPACVTRAAQSLATLARGTSDPAVVERAVEPLRSRLAVANATDIRLRGALLEAMASMGAERFSAEFIDGLQEENPDLLLPSIRGVIAAGAKDQLPRLRDLFLHADVRVRLQAIEAVGDLGAGDNALEVLWKHLPASGEADESVRAAAWVAFLKVAGRESPKTRLSWADRLKDIPGRPVDYLTALVDEFAVANPQPAELGVARERLVKILREQKRYAESVRHLQELYTALLVAGNPRADEIGVLLLDSILRNGQHSERVEQLLAGLAERGDEIRAKVVRTITDYLTETKTARPPAEFAALVQRLRTACTGLYGEAFDTHLEGLVREATPQPTTKPSQPPDPAK